MFTKKRLLKKARKSGLLMVGGGLLAAFVVMLAALSPVPRVQAATTVINLCGQNTTNRWNLLSNEMSNLRAKLDNPANFGPAGTYGDFDFNYVDVGDNFTEAILAGNSCNIWFSGYEDDSTYTPTEFIELQNWVNNHNGQVFAGCDSSSYDPVCDLLDFAVTNDLDSYGFVVQQLVNPITCDGVLTPDDTLEMSGGAGAYFTGPGVTATNVLAVHETSGVADPAKPIIIYTGDFFMTSDIDMVSTYTLTSGGSVTNNNDVMAVNAFSALADVSLGNDICSSAGPQIADLTITKATNPAGGTDFPFVLNPDDYHFLAKWGTPGSGNGQFYNPYDAAVDGDGNVYVVDTGNSRIQKFDDDGGYLTQWGGYGSGNGQFNNPVGVAVDGDGNVYVADYNNNRIQKFDGDGGYLTQWGTSGSGNGQFSYPVGVAIDGDGNVYVVDYGNHRIQKFDGGGAYLTQWGGFGSGNGQFSSPFGVAVDGDGNVYVADNSNHRIQKFDGGGGYLGQWGTLGSGDGQFNSPVGVAVDGDGNVYVADYGNHRIQKFGPDGATLDDGQSHTFSGLLAGDHVVIERVPDDWTLDDIDCGSATATRDGNTVSVTLAAGDDVTCTFTNVQTPTGGTITVTKQAGDVGDEFEFDPSWSGDNFFLLSGGAETSDPLPAGTYSVVEVNLPLGWSQQSATCDNAATTPVETVSPASITVADGDEWVCIFTNVYTPPPTNICTVPTSPLYTDIIGKGMGNTKKHKNQVKMTIPNYAAVDSLYGQMVAKNTGNANYVRFILPGKNNWVQVNTITGPADMSGGNFWYGDYIDPAKTVTGRWFLQKNGAKNHIPRALVLYPTYESATNTYVNIWNTYDAAEGEAYWDTANGWTQERVIVESIAPPNGPTTFNVELAVVDNDKDARPIWVTVEAGGVTQTQMPNNPSHADQLNLMTFTLANVPAGTDEITITVYSPSMAVDGVEGDSAMLVGMAANYMCAPLD